MRASATIIILPIVARERVLIDRMEAAGLVAGWERVGMLRAYGNAIVPQTAAAFISAAMEACDVADH